MVDTFSGWIEAFPTKKETALTVAKKLLEEIVPWFGVPVAPGSNNSPSFVPQVTQGIAKMLETGNFIVLTDPQNSGQIERMNRTLQETLTKLTLKTGADWTMFLPMALLRANNTRHLFRLTPFEILYGRPPPKIPYWAKRL